MLRNKHIWKWFAPLVMTTGVALAESDQIENTFLAAADTGNTVISGEQLDEFTGDVRWSVKEFSLPGQGGMDIDIYRSFNLADHGKEILGPWTIDVPRLSYVIKAWSECRDHGDKGQHCWGEHEVSGITLEIPGSKAVPLVIKDGELLSVRGEVGWKGRIDELNVTAYSPDGKTYVFDQNQSADIKSNYNVGGQLLVYASSVTDAYGNWIKYKYHRKVSTDYVRNGQCTKFPMLKAERESCEGSDIAAKEHIFPKQITTNDGRLIDFNYGEPTQESVTSAWRFGAASPAGVIPYLKEIVVHESTGNRVWKYDHYFKEEMGQQIHDGLKTVTLPDNTTWNFTYMDKKGKKLQSITTPTGATITYDYEVISTTHHPRGVGQYSLSKRTLKGTELEGAVTTFSYADVWFDNDRFWQTVSVSPSAKTEKVFWHTNNSINDDRKAREGQLYSVKVFEPAGGNPLRTIEYTYDTWGKVGRFYGENLNIKNLYAIKNATPLMQTKVVVDGKFITQFSDFTNYYQPQTKTEITGSNKRVTRYTYLNQQWSSPTKPQLIGLPKQIKVEGENGEYWSSNFSYHDSGKLKGSKVDNLTTWFNYHPSGDISDKIYINHLGNQKITYSDHFRGVARIEAYPDGSSITRSVNPSGTVEWEEDGEGNRTYFSYDSMGRMTKMAPPEIAATSYTYEPNKFIETIEGTEYRKAIALNGLGQPYLFKESGSGLDPVYIRREYDSAGREVFVSYPSLNKREREGVEKKYDALNRPLTIINTVDNSYMKYCYGVSCVSNVAGYAFDYAYTTTNLRGFKTTHLQQVFGATTQAWDSYLIEDISSNDKQVTSIKRNKVGNPISIEQGGVVRTYSYAYDSQRLSGVKEPERSDVTLAYDDAGNLRTRAVTGVGITTYSYDEMNRLVGVDYPSGHDVSFTYDRNGQVKTLNKGLSTRTYLYTSFGELDKETLTVTVNTPKTFELGYAYNELGQIKRLDYPNGFYVEYGLNDLGQVTRIDSPHGTLLDRAQYYPNGVLKLYEYGNGQVIEQSLNNRRFVDRTTSAKGSTVASDLTYAFLHDGNIAGIQNHVDNAQSIYSMAYDGIGRLITANGPWGSGSFKYDAKGNLRTKNLGAMGEINYTYDPVTNLLSNTTGSLYSFQYDGYGNVTNNGRFTMSYDHSGNLTSIVTNSNPVANVSNLDIDYEYDGNGLRVLEIHDDKGIYQMHSQSGNVMYEEDLINDIATNYVYFNDKLIAEVERTITPGYYCAPGWTLDGVTCTRTLMKDPGQSCPDGFEIKFGECSKTESANLKLVCPAGYVFLGIENWCWHTDQIPATPSCPDSFDIKPRNGWYSCFNPNHLEYQPDAEMICSNGWRANPSTHTCDQVVRVRGEETCPDGFSRSDSKCYKTTTNPVNYSCPSDYSLSGATCLKHESQPAVKEGF
ncbi:hypothetical protein ONV78_13335 [Hahella sp. CR1]|uniref:RHS repeat domain-containing protein n=1 Tax=Hahella sp. CR1 TaxID=2992807 RepID=UPI00244166C5|nr:hypothetical protein [Hahella sp. CR1]MDG9668720.1 hypothetical protein [Hahella sp. CR1]